MSKLVSEFHKEEAFSYKKKLDLGQVSPLVPRTLSDTLKIQSGMWHSIHTHTHTHARARARGGGFVYVALGY